LAFDIEAGRVGETNDFLDAIDAPPDWVQIVARLAGRPLCEVEDWLAQQARKHRRNGGRSSTGRRRGRPPSAQTRACDLVCELEELRSAHPSLSTRQLLIKIVGEQNHRHGYELIARYYSAIHQWEEAAFESELERRRDEEAGWPAFSRQ
jgi:hypothetical protein